MQTHTIPPVYAPSSRVLILGSFPSVQSRAEGFYYAHPRNRFWPVLAAVLNASTPQTIGQKQQLLLDNGIALWDVVAACDITGSADSSLKNARPNDIGLILKSCKIKAVFLNGHTAERLYNKLLLPSCNVRAICLPSTSPANAACTLDKLIAAWACVGRV